MTDREKFLSLLEYGRTDDPFALQWMGYSHTVLERWRGEGMPGDVAEADLPAYFGLADIVFLPVHPYLPREDIVLEEGDHFRIVIDNRGRTVRYDDLAPHIPQYLDHPLKHCGDFEAYKERLGRGCSARFEPFLSRLETYTRSDKPVLFGFRGCWEISKFFGMEGAMLMLHDDPDGIREILDFWFEHQWEIFDEVCRHRVPDAVTLWEDLAYKNGPFISPGMYKRFFARYHRETADRLRAHGVRHFLVDNDGDIDALLPLYLENGITGTYPLECQSGACPLKYRGRFGRNVQLIGGIDKRVLWQGRDAIRSEVESKLIPLLPDGGYIPGLDHAVPPEVPLDMYRFYVECLKDTWRRAAG